MYNAARAFRKSNPPAPLSNNQRYQTETWSRHVILPFALLRWHADTREQTIESRNYEWHPTSLHERTPCNYPKLDFSGFFWKRTRTQRAKNYLSEITLRCELSRHDVDKKYPFESLGVISGSRCTAKVKVYFGKWKIYSLRFQLRMKYSSNCLDSFLPYSSTIPVIKCIHVLQV